MMPSYIISYDLYEARSEAYENLIATIKGFSNWAKVTESTWVVVTQQSEVQVRDLLLAHLKASDRIIVCKSAGIGAWKNVICENDWLVKYL